MESGRDPRGHACALLLLVAAVLAGLSVPVVADSATASAESAESARWWNGFAKPSSGGANWPVLEVDARVVAAVVLTSVGTCICSASGVGGGGLYLPIFNLLLLFSAETAAALSNIMILACSLAVLAWNVWLAHPFSPEKPLIDYDVALLVTPSMLLGVSVGVFSNIMFPGWLLISVLTATLFYMTSRSVKSGFSRWRKESSAAEAGKANAAEHGGSAGSETAPLLASRLEPRCPPQKLLKLALVWLLFFAVQVLRGGQGTKGILADLKPCGLAYWVLSASQLPLALGLTAWMAFNHSSDAHSCPPSPSESESEDVDVLADARAYTLFPSMALVAGAMGGMLGIGGGMLIYSMLIEVGMHPLVTAATTQFIIFFASSMSVLQFWLLGRIPMDFALLFGSLCFVFSCVGVGVLQTAIVKFGRSSVMVILAGLVMGISALLMATFGGWAVWRQFQAGASMGFHSPCAAGGP